LGGGAFGKRLGDLLEIGAGLIGDTGSGRGGFSAGARMEKESSSITMSDELPSPSERSAVSTGRARQSARTMGMAMRVMSSRSCSIFILRFRCRMTSCSRCMAPQRTVTTFRLFSSG
jgi:hypothetical protein